MCYGHAANLTHSGKTPDNQEPPVDQPEKTKTDTSGGTRPSPVAPEWYARPELAPVLFTHDVGALYRALTETGLSQHGIARLTRQTQSEVCEILKGRRVVTYEVLVRVASGLGVPPERIGLSWWGPDGRLLWSCSRQPPEENEPRDATSPCARPGRCAHGG